MRHDENSPLRHRIFNAAFIVGICMAFSCAVVNYLLGLGTADTLMTLACGLIIVGLYVLFRIKKNYELVSLIVVVFLNFIFCPIMWIVAGGSYSGMPYYMIINAGIIALLLIGFQRKIILSLFALVVGVLMAIEYQSPSILVGYDSKLVRYIDLSFGLFTCLFSIAVLIAVLIDSYMDELQKSKQYLETLEEKNREIEAKNRMLEIKNVEFIKAKEETEKLNKLLYEEKQKLEKLSITDY